MAGKVAIPEFRATAVDGIATIANTARATYRTNQTKNLNWRKVQLRKLYWALVDFEPLILEALHRDLRKSAMETLLAELEFCKYDCMWMLNNLDRLAKDEKILPPEIPLLVASASFRVRKEPLGTVLIIGPYNFPLMLCLSPLAGAIAAGCTAVIKPSELTPATAMVLAEMVEKRLDRAAFRVVNGAIPETTALLEQKWDKIFFTGSEMVGTIVAKKAAETLTPVCLELGGTNPVFVTKKASLAVAARRLLWAKTQNAGQICVAHSYVLVEKDAVDTFIRCLNDQCKVMLPNGARASPEYPRIVNKRHFQRLKKMVDNSRGKIVLGGQMDESDLFIEPTAVLVTSASDSMMTEETFGPIFAILPFSTLDEAINIANNVHRTPLALSTFGSSSENEKVLGSMTSGGASLNDSFMHGSIVTAPFGGVGASGTGCYRGKASFDCFSHRRTVAHAPYWMEPFLRMRYMPYNRRLVGLWHYVNSFPVDFDRNGQMIKGLRYWTTLLLGLGASSVKGAFVRWLVVLASVFLGSKRMA